MSLCRNIIVKTFCHCGANLRERPDSLHTDAHALQTFQHIYFGLRVVSSVNKLSHLYEVTVLTLFIIVVNKADDSSCVDSELVFMRVKQTGTSKQASKAINIEGARIRSGTWIDWRNPKNPFCPVSVWRASLANSATLAVTFPSSLTSERRLSLERLILVV